MSRRLLVTLLVVVFAASACGTNRLDNGRRADGPIAETGAYTWFNVIHQDEVFSDGMQMFIVGGHAPVTIDDVQVTGGEDTLEFLGARIGLPGRPDDFNQDMKGFPPRAVPAQFQVPATGALLDPGERYMLILGFRSSRRSSIVGRA